MIFTLTDTIFLYVGFDDVVGLGLNLLYMGKTNQLHFMLKVLHFKLVIGRIEED